MFKYDTVHGRYAGTCEAQDNKLIVDGNEIAITNSLLAKEIQWGNSGADYVVEASGSVDVNLLVE